MINNNIKIKSQEDQTIFFLLSVWKKREGKGKEKEKKKGKKGGLVQKKEKQKVKETKYDLNNLLQSEKPIIPKSLYSLNHNIDNNKVKTPKTAKVKETASSKREFSKCTGPVTPTSPSITVKKISLKVVFFGICEPCRK